MKDALMLACEEIAAVSGSCPYDIHDLYEPWEESCYQRCVSDIDTAKCWRRYFEEKAGEMGRNQQKGAKFEQACADYITRRTGDEVIRRRLGGAQDKGDLHGVRHLGKRVTTECKDCRDMRLAEWLDEAEVERGNDDGAYGIVIHHRKGKGAAQFGENYVTMSLDTFLAMCVGGPDLLY